MFNNFFAVTKLALINLASAKLRSFLAVLGILVGTASVVAMVSGGELATNEALKQFKNLGTDLLSIVITDASRDGDRVVSEQNLTLPQALSVKNADPSILIVSPYTQNYSAISYNGKNLDGQVIGVIDNFPAIINLQLAHGRFISKWDGSSKFCVIGDKVSQAIAKLTFRNPLGQQVLIGDNYFTIVGVAKPWPENNFIYANLDYSVMIPIVASMQMSKYVAINTMIMRIKPNADIDSLKDHLQAHIKNMLGDRHIYFRSAKELINTMSKQSRILTILLSLIGGISLLVGGIGVMNIMLVSIVERRREIGIRLAIGATKFDICIMFLIEAIILALIGGVFGVLIGDILTYVIAKIWHWEFILFLLPPLIGFLVSVAVGIFFGFYPAYKASQLDPIVALRSE